ncbi:leucyl-tRNA synthetase [Methanococcus maripaludis]|uniref:Leucine--tRNA ligase n=1 Tax=Methanococcus maripaludis TaxID=39152 RepID=A0A7J9NV85_METMI|nr:leucine--tRNA ligase [Methanococcus maripaludis]MBA2850893.1 leucyl-tRNA synthetase [Methanococcus maripaludis]
MDQKEVTAETGHKSVDLINIMDKWQKKWTEAKIFEAEHDSRDKFFITAAFPYLNGVLHAGHLRTFTIPETIARYQRMKNKNVLWTFGFHVTGTPILGLANQIKERKEDIIWAYNNLHNIPMDELLKLNTPEAIVECFSKKATEAFKRMGFSLDWRRNFKTDDKVFSKFIEWQFYKLKEMGHITKGSHPVRYCPKCENPVEDHDLLHGEESTTVEYSLIKFTSNFDGKEIIMPMATLRPETVFGVTNAWVNPNEIYVMAEVHDEIQKLDSEDVDLKYNGIWIIGKECADKLKEQDRKIEILKEIKGSELLGLKIKNPVTKKEVPLLPADFVEMGIGTGCVMSVPAHAPYDYVALRDLGKVEEVGLIPLIEIEGYDKYPAKEIVEKLGVKDQNDEELLEQATSKIYKDEFHKGKLNENCGEYAGISVKDIKEKLTKDYINSNIAEIMYEFSEQKVVCRCGEKCIIKTVKGQWFINYSDENWKKLAHECIDNMNFAPEGIRQEFHNKVDWMKDKACARKKGLGTILPFDENWIIESLSDSTIYMAYYTIARFINEGLTPEQLIPELFDYVYLGTGNVEEIAKNSKIPAETIEEMRKEFLYYYPLDWRCSAKDLIPNHLTFMIFNHVALFGREHWPKGIEINGYVTIEGKKLSKSKGPVLPVSEVAENFGADVARFYITTCAELPQDADVKFKEMEKARDNLIKLYDLAVSVMEEESAEKELSLIDKWLLHKTYSSINSAETAYEEFQLRKIGLMFYELINDLRWYKRRGGENNSVLKEVVEIWTKLLSPVTPHLCEEIWEKLGYDGFISQEMYPVIKPELINEDLELGEEFIKSAMEDIRNIKGVAKINPEKMYLYTADDWKYDLLEFMNENAEKNVKALIPMVMKEDKFKRHGKEVMKLINEIMKIGVKKAIAEVEILENAKTFIESEFDCEVIVNGEDVKGKKKFAIPYKPAIYLK